MPGGGGGGTATTQSTVNTNTGPWSEQSPYLKDVFSAAGGLYNYGKGNLKSFPDSTVSPFSSAQTQGYQDIINRGQAGSPFLPASNTNATDTLNGNYLDPSSNPWLRKTFDSAADAVTRQFQTATAPTTDSFFSGNGAYNSSARYNAQNNNNLGLGETLDKLATGIYGGNYGQERQNQMATQGMVPSLMGAQYIDPSMAVNAGAAQQGQSQAQLTDKVNKFNFDQMSPWQTLGLFKSMVDGSYGQNGTTNSTSTQPLPQSNTGGQILGGALGLGSLAANFAMPGVGGISAFGNMFSDARLKEDIHQVGTTNDGQNLYSYRYKGDPTPHVGLMAQEVEKTNPDAVIEHPSGFKMVNYDLALLPSVFAARR